MPAMVNVPTPELASTHDAPTRVTVTTCPVVEPVAVHEVYPAPVRAMVGVAGMAKPLGKVVVIEDPATSEPLDEAVKPTVQVSVVLAWLVAPAKVTEVTDDGVVIETLDPTVTAVVSEDVFTVYPAVAIEVDEGFVMARIVKLPDVAFASAHDTPAKVMVTT
jgi:hypothetical protein